MIGISQTGFWSGPLRPIVITYNSGFTIGRHKEYGINGTMYNPKNLVKKQFIACTGGVGERGEFRETQEDCGEEQWLEGVYTINEGPNKGTQLHNFVELYTCDESPDYEKHLGNGASGAPVYKGHYAVGIYIGSGEFNTDTCIDDTRA